MILYVVLVYVYHGVLLWDIIQWQPTFTVYSALMALLFSFFLIYDTQQLIGGKKYAISPEEHIFAAIQVKDFKPQHCLNVWRVFK